MDKTRILIAGGDMRQIYCALRLAETHDVSVAGFAPEHIPPQLAQASAGINSRKYDCAVLPVPPIDSSGCINTPLGGEVLSAERVRSLLRSGAAVLTGKADPELDTLFAGHPVIDYMQREELCLRNAIPTAEGAVQLAVSELPVTLNGLSVLIAGLGRIGTALAQILRGFGAEVTAAVRNSQGAARAELLGIRSVRTENISPDYGLVFNTVPRLIFTRPLLEQFSADTLIIDLASRPGGIDFSAAADLGIRAVWALGLPGKTAPVTAGEIIAGTVCDILEERSRTV